MGKKEGLKKDEILRKRKELWGIKKEGKKLTSAYFTIYYQASKEEGKRKICFAVDREVKKATERNYLKRRMREVYRQNKDSFPLSFYYFIQAKASSLNLPHDAFKKELFTLTQRIKNELA